MFTTTSILEGGTRIRLSARLIEAWGIGGYPDNFPCYGYFRAWGELLCAPCDLKLPDATHPYAEVIEHLQVQPLPPEPTLDLRSIPSARELVTADRIIRFDAKWTSARKQLDLYLGVDVTSRLGWVGDHKTLVYMASGGGSLIILSAAQYESHFAASLLA